MKTLASKVLYYILLGVALLLVVPEFIRTIVYVGGHIKYYWYFFGGGALYAVAALTLLKTNLQYYQTKHHESLHETACQILLRPIESITATSGKGGQLVHGGSSNLFITLAPYSFPVFTYFFLLIQLMVSPKFPYYALLTGFTFFFFLHAVYRQTGPRQPDLKRYGLPLSYMFIACFLLLNISIILYAVKMNIWKGFLYYFEDIWRVVKGVLTTGF